MSYTCLLPKVVYFSHVLSFPRKQASQLLKKGCIPPRHLEDSASSAGTVHSISVVDSARFTPDQAVFWAIFIEVIHLLPLQVLSFR